MLKEVDIWLKRNLIKCKYLSSIFLFTFIRRNRSFKKWICCSLGFLEGLVKSAGTKLDIWNYCTSTKHYLMPWHLSCMKRCIPHISLAVSTAAWFSLEQREQESSLALHLCFPISSLHLSIPCCLGFLQQICDALEYSRRFTCFHGRTICT